MNILSGTLKDDGKIIDSINEVVKKNPEFKPEQKTIIQSKPSTTLSTPEPTSECHSILGYPCCSPENTEIIYTDEEGNWSFENGDLCLMSGSTTTTTTTIVEPTSTPTNSEPRVTIKTGHSVYWFYHAFTNECLVLTSRKGYFYSMAHPDYCLHVSDVDSVR